VGRLRAMRRAGTNAPVGANYNKAFGLWLDEHQWARELDKATRNHALWAAENRGQIERWRETLAREADGSLFDLKKDSVKVIATTIAGNVSLHRLTALQQALGDEIKAINTAQKQAG